MLNQLRLNWTSRFFMGLFFHYLWNWLKPHLTKKSLWINWKQILWVWHNPIGCTPSEWIIINNKTKHLLNRISCSVTDIKLHSPGSGSTKIKKNETMLTSNNQYIHADYLSPMPNTVSATIKRSLEFFF